MAEEIRHDKRQRDRKEMLHSTGDRQHFHLAVRRIVIADRVIASVGQHFADHDKYQNNTDIQHNDKDLIEQCALLHATDQDVHQCKDRSHDNCRTQFHAGYRVDRNAERLNLTAGYRKTDYDIEGADDNGKHLSVQFCQHFACCSNTHATSPDHNACRTETQGKAVAHGMPENGKSGCVNALIGAGDVAAAQQRHTKR